MSTTSHDSSSSIAAARISLSSRRSLLLLMVSGAGTTTCGMTSSFVTPKQLMPKATVDVHTQKLDGTETHYHKDVENFDDVKELANDAAHAASEVTQTMIEKLTEVPPPGNVTLASLSPNFSQFEGSAMDYVTLAKTKEPDKFQYVQIGVEGYDAFFRACAEFYAFVY